MPKEPKKQNITIRGGKQYTPDNPPPESKRTVNTRKRKPAGDLEEQDSPTAPAQ